MKVGINFTDLIPGKIGGMENYMRSVLHYFPKVDNSNHYIIFAHKEIESTLPKEGYEIVFVDSYERDRLSLELKAKVESNNIDVWWSPLLILDPLDLNIPTTFSIPDMQHEYYPDFFTKEVLDWRKKYFQLSALSASVIFTISERSKDDICRFLNVAPEKVIVTYLDSAPWFNEQLNGLMMNEVKNKHELPEKYIFFPANTWPHKNHKTLIESFKLVHERHPDLVLMLTGYGSNAHEDIVKQIKESGLSKNIRFLGYVDKKEIPYIYKAAQCLVFPSLFEGFGIPIVEAMRSECPVVCSNNTSIPEVAGEACLYFDPLDVQDIAEKVISLIESPLLRAELVEKGREQVEKFSYERCARQTLDELAELHQNYRKKAPIADGKLPLVSIVTPSYNQGRFIKRTIDSVLNQDYPNIEYVVMDGGSTDETVEILKSYGDKLRWVSQKDGGQANAINNGLAIAKGEIVAWLNSDDTYEPGAISRVVRFFNENPEAKFVHGNGDHIDVNDAFIEKYPSEKCSFERFHRSCPICQPTAFWKKEIMDEIGYLNESWNYGMDYDYWIRVSQKYELHFIEDHLANTRVYSDTKTFNDPEKPSREAVRIIDSHYETVSSDWIYAYAHARLHGHVRGTKFSEFTFRLRVIVIAARFFLKYNGKIPKQDRKMMVDWFKGGILSLLRIWK